ncbi:MAG: zf-HC2 domain-containing protein [Acidimicrobiales bacterium]|nr:zf-HC2 domain-containing protein [Acidimicrobiales bacterium]
MRHPAHRRIRREVEVWLDGELHSPDRIVEVESHLDECPDCRQDLDVLQRMKCSLRRLASNRPTDLTAARLHRWARRLSP